MPPHDALPADTPLGRQRDLNRASANAWRSYTAHRLVVTELVLHGASFGPRLVVLGAGNCNDLDLHRVTRVFPDLHLVDLDGEALERALTRQDPKPRHRIHLHGAIDIGDPGHALDEIAPADVVLSAGILSQLIQAAIARGSRPRELLDVRDAHLCAILGLLRPGGAALLINDIVSSDSVPHLRDHDTAELPDLMTHLLGTGNFFTGCNPNAIAQHLARPAAHRPLATGTRISAPWRWNMGTRSYLTCAITFNRAQPHDPGGESENEDLMRASHVR